MVEGPGATRNANKARRLIGYASQSNGQVLTRVLSVGKEVFLVFDNDGDGDNVAAIRLHFGMNGSLGFHKRQQSKWGNSNTTDDPTFEMQFVTIDKPIESATLICYSTTVSYLTATVARFKYERLCCLDVCASEETEQFDCEKVLQALRTRPTAMLADVLLDQNRFPGVGNIIKVEGLHRAKLHPKKRVEECSDTELDRVIQRCRSYAMAWYKQGRAPAKLVYNHSVCQTCRGMSVRIEKMGSDLSRTTFWCDQCQPLTTTTTHHSPLIASTPRNAKGKENAASTSCDDSRFLYCPQHGTKTVQLRRVRKQNTPNVGRIFVSCSQCPSFFQWADRPFACTKCKSHRLLRMSKTAHSGGKWFLSCDKCKSFAWAQPADLKPLQNKLTPLL